MEYTHSVVKALWLTKGDIRQHYATLPGCTELYGKHTQTRTFEHHANLLAYMANRPLCTMENGFWGVVECQGSPFLGFAQAFSETYFLNEPASQNRLPLKHRDVYWWLRNYVHGYTSTSRLCLMKSSLPSLYPLCHSYGKIFRLSPFKSLSSFFLQSMRPCALASVLQAMESCARPGNKHIPQECIRTGS